jgi:hypothetical protein
VAGAASLTQRGWFYPGCRIIVAAHYLSFVLLYGIRTFALLAAALASAGFAIGLMSSGRVVLGGWVEGVILFVFVILLLAAYKSGKATRAGSPLRIEDAAVMTVLE